MAADGQLILLFPADVIHFRESFGCQAHAPTDREFLDAPPDGIDCDFVTQSLAPAAILQHIERIAHGFCPTSQHYICLTGRDGIAPLDNGQRSGNARTGDRISRDLVRNPHDEGSQARYILIEIGKDIPEDDLIQNVAVQASPLKDFSHDLYLEINRFN
jgi:hypothetical protein